MEVELVTEGLSEDDYYNIDDINEDYSNFEGERCGICMDIVIDRGVLDCCQHWFCFTCIDNWATITNLCPLCQNEFQLITCVPVYDSIGNNKTDEDVNSGDDDWSIDGKNNTLSFPSYYIDENAVACLDGDGCKFRSGSATIDEDANLDTSIACDSCDKWYHAFCVGFDTESTCEESWLCPRCLVKETPEKSDGIPVSKSKQLGLENVSHECIVGSTLAGKVSVSVADVGETAVVVSMVEGDQVSQESSGQFPMSDFGKDLKVDAPLSNSIANAPKLETVSCEGSNVGSIVGTQQGLELSLSGISFFSSSSHSVVLPDLMTSSDEKKTGELKLLDGLKSSLTDLSGAPTNDKLLESGLDLHLGLSVGSSSAADLINSEGAKAQVPGYVLQKYDSGECLLPAEKVMDDKKEMFCTKMKVPDTMENGVAGAKRKHSDSRDDDGDSKAKIEAKYSLKKVKAEGKSKHSQSKDKADESQSGGLRKISNSITTPKNETGMCSPDKEKVTNIRDIVQETRHKPLRQHARSDPADTSSKERENASGVRVKKILRRTSNDKDTSLVVQRLRKEIREAVRNKSSKELGENLFDPKLLAAFRAVVSGQTTETKRIPVDLKAKKSLLQKGKVREHLTKKIYGVGGKRRRAWTRDCEIEFWKYRCSKVSKPEKVKTLKSVLDLLRYDSDDKKVEDGKEGETSNTFLSRLYLADTSVFPRKNDIKPASAREAAADGDQNKECRSTEKASTPSSCNLSKISLLKNELLSHVVDLPLATKANKKSVPEMKPETTSTTLHPNKRPKGPPVSSSGATKATPQKESIDNIKTDKRKWALELLARKTAVVGKNTTQEKEEDNAVLKGNYPLLAQLPKDMRPELAAIRHNKIPPSVRQAQLYRLAEHFLRKQIYRLFAELQKEQLRRTDTNSVKVTESNASSTSKVASDKAEANSDSCNDLVVDEALKAAGLLSDSPPGSPHQAVDEMKEEVGVSERIEDDGPDNVFEVDSHPELDIYGDFEYNLEDDDFIGASALKISKPQPEDSKIKVLLSTLNNPDKLDSVPDILDHEKSETVEVREGSSGLPECHISSGGAAVDVCTDNCPSQSSTLDVGEEPSLAECEELYGPDKEPLIKKYPETASIKPCEPLANNEKGEMVDHVSRNMEKELEDKSSAGNSEKAEDLHCLWENSSSHSQKIENASEKEKRSKSETNKSDSCNLVAKKVEGYIKEHIRPLCKSGVITVEQYRWAVGKTSEKVMKYHSKDKNANFLIKEGEKVKKLAEQYVEAAQQQMTKNH